jgi:hypothetical protein
MHLDPVGLQRWNVTRLERGDLGENILGGWIRVAARNAMSQTARPQQRR